MIGSFRLPISLGDTTAPTIPTAIFLMSIDTTKGLGTNDFYLLLATDGTDGYIDWGDTNITLLNSTSEVSYLHTYSTSGTYQIKLYGGIDYLRHSNSNNDLKVISIDQWGPFPYRSLNFSGCENLTANYSDTPAMKNGVNLDSFFNGCTNFDGDTSSFIGKPSNMSSAFKDAINFNSGLTMLDTSSVTSMYAMFWNATNFNGNITSWDTSSVTTMKNMFSACYLFNQDIGGWDVSSVTNMFSMFRDCYLFNQDIGGWDVSNVTDMFTMFLRASAFNQDLNTWDTSSVTNMAYMFRDCYLFNQDIGGWDVSSVANMKWMFRSATAFNQSLNSWDTSSATDMSDMFYNATIFNQPLDDWDVSNVTNMAGMFYRSGLDSTNYEALLIGWTGWIGGSATKSLQSDVPFHGGNATYSIGSDAEDARDYLTNTLNWTIIDGGGI